MKIALIILGVMTCSLVFGGCSAQTSLTHYTPTTTTVHQALNTTTSQPTTAQSSSTTSSSGQAIVIDYSGIQTDQPSVGIFDNPMSGYIYEVITFTVTNQGYSLFSSDPFYFGIIVSSIKYSYDNASYDLLNPLPNVSVLNGESITGSLAYQVPIGTTTFKPYYNGVGTYNIQWVAQ